MAKLSRDELAKLAAKPLSKEAVAHNLQIYSRIGEFIAAWATVESLFISVFGLATGMSRNNAAVVLYSFHSSRAKRNLIAALAHDNLSQEDCEAVADLIKRFKAPSKLRNELAHSQYHHDPAIGILDRYTTANLDDYRGGEPVYRTDLDRQWHNRMKTMAKALHDFNIDLWNFISELKARPPKPKATEA